MTVKRGKRMKKERENASQEKRYPHLYVIVYLCPIPTGLYFLVA
jgi:hypothetical protein